ncbi:Sodium-dependent phosphate transport protein 2B [Phytophthora citrophthora]|uniref:Sodium-dependent phosphate transport protein 2B n=1 Tax=Phytophthora citrophthora TaxID=4793 RepID=A0AAD9LRD9_9STRA|nr:Sodium-dependent phosphate transport protein 2B [Phytophthora citrophthora]
MPHESGELLVLTTNESFSDEVHLECDEEDCERAKTLNEKLARGFGYVIVSVTALYFFMVGVKVLDDGLTLSLRCNSANTVVFGDNFIVSLMAGIVASALLHSSTIVISIVVALVSSAAMSIRQAVYVIMGANVGTCVSCVVVAFGQLGDRTQFQRAVAAATVHDMYNIWSVVVLLPIEEIFHPLERISLVMAGSDAVSNNVLSAIVDPLVQALVMVDKKAVAMAATGEISCSDDQSFVNRGIFEGLDLSDGSIGGITVFLGFSVLVCAIFTLVKTLTMVFMGPIKVLISKLLNYNGYVTIVVGTFVTLAIHSSTVITSTLTPMAGLGLISLEQVYPLVIGANLGTTGTVVLASYVTGNSNAVATALVHFWFNLLGFFLFYPVPITRKLILKSAESLAFASVSWPLVIVLFLVVLFILLPTDLLILMAMTKAHNVAFQVIGWTITAVEITAFGYFALWYMKKGGHVKWHEFLERRSLERQDGLEWFYSHEVM